MAVLFQAEVVAFHRSETLTPVLHSSHGSQRYKFTKSCSLFTCSGMIRLFLCLFFSLPSSYVIEAGEIIHFCLRFAEYFRLI